VNKGAPPIDSWKQAIAFHRQGRLAEAEAGYWRVLVERSDAPELLCNLGAALSGQGKHHQAVACYRRAIAVDPEDWKAHANLGNALRRMGKLDRAQASYRHAIDADDGIALLHYSLGDTLRQRGHLDQAAASLQKALELQPDYIEAFIALSAIEETLGHHDRARKILLGGISRRPYYTETCQGRPLATALLFFGLQDCRFRLNDVHELKMSGGHFHTTDLLRRRKFTKHHFHISAGNLPADPSALPRHDLIVNTIACPDREGRSLKTLSRFLQGAPHAPLINHPDHVLQTTRDANHARLHDIEGMTFPRTLRVSAGGTDWQGVVRSILDAGFSFPVIMRRVGTQSAVSAQKLNAPEEVERYLIETEGEEFYAIQYVDCRFRENYYRKLRLFCIDGRLYPVVCHIDAVWNVHGGNRKTLMKQHPWMQAEERRFLEDFTSYIGLENRRRLETLHAKIGLDFYGIDFTLMADGSLLVYELNAAMRHSLVHAQSFPYMTPHLNAISDAFEAMAIRKAAGR